MLTWKYCVGCLFMYFSDIVLGLLACGVSGKGAGIAGFLMREDGVSCAVFGGLVTVMVSGVLISSVCSAGGEVSFSGAVDSRRTVGIDLVGGGRIAAVCWRGQWSNSSCVLARPLASRGCRLPPAFGPLLVHW